MTSTGYDSKAFTNATETLLALFGKKRITPKLREVQAAHGMKRCSTCKLTLPLGEFCISRRNPDGLHHHCNDCNRSNTKRWHGVHRDEHNESKRAYRAANQEQINEIRRGRYASERGRLQDQLYQGRRRATRAGLQADKIAPEELLAYWEILGINPLRCYLTGEQLTPSTRSLDHVVAISNGGSHTVDNLMPCKPETNTSKHNKSFDDYSRERER